MVVEEVLTPLAKKSRFPNTSCSKEQQTGISFQLEYYTRNLNCSGLTYPKYLCGAHIKVP
jgi:hypothetical protein